MDVKNGAYGAVFYSGKIRAIWVGTGTFITPDRVNG